jgi:hypothetical protein
MKLAMSVVLTSAYHIEVGDRSWNPRGDPPRPDNPNEVALILPSNTLFRVASHHRLSQVHSDVRIDIIASLMPSYQIDAWPKHSLSVPSTHLLPRSDDPDEILIAAAVITPHQCVLFPSVDFSSSATT